MNSLEYVPTVEEETPVTSLNGLVFRHPATHCRPHELFTFEPGEINESDFRAISLYLANFCSPIKTLASQVRCPACGTEVKHENSPVVSAKKLTVDNSQTAESRCPNCAYPIRTRHLIWDLHHKRLLVKLDFFPMFYHPRAVV